MTALLDHLWQSTLFALPLGALTLLLRRHAAAVRFWVWFAASVKFLVPFSLLMAIGAAVTLPVAPMLPGGPTLEVLQDTAAPFTKAPAASVVPDGTTNWIMVLIAIWAAGTVLALLIWGKRWLELRALVLAARPLTSPLGDISTTAGPDLIGACRTRPDRHLPASPDVAGWHPSAAQPAKKWTLSWRMNFATSGGATTSPPPSICWWKACSGFIRLSGGWAAS